VIPALSRAVNVLPEVIVLDYLRLPHVRLGIIVQQELQLHFNVRLDIIVPPEQVVPLNSNVQLDIIAHLAALLQPKMYVLRVIIVL
jgi:hypothetical protein